MAHEALTSRRLAADGKTARNITVAAVELAWDKPLRPLVWLRLHGVVLAGAKAPDKGQDDGSGWREGIERGAGGRLRGKRRWMPRTSQPTWR